MSEQTVNALTAEELAAVRREISTLEPYKAMLLQLLFATIDARDAALAAETARREAAEAREHQLWALLGCRSEVLARLIEFADTGCPVHHLYGIWDDARAEFRKPLPPMPPLRGTATAPAPAEPPVRTTQCRRCPTPTPIGEPCPVCGDVTLHADYDDGPAEPPGQQGEQ